jgi:riboflavin synthase
MFTGIVSDVGQVRHIEKRGDTHVVIATHYDVSDIEIGASISCSGACMTVVDKGNEKDRWFAFTASGETLSKTTLGDWKVGDAVNLERAMRVGDELGGHIVTGHVDGVAEVKSVLPEGESLRVIFEAPVLVARFIAPKGSVALDGISLTVNDVDGARFGVNIIPHTSKVTTFGRLKPGAKVNLEVDLMARYVARLVNRCVNHRSITITFRKLKT